LQLIKVQHLATSLSFAPQKLCDDKSVAIDIFTISHHRSKILRVLYFNHGSRKNNVSSLSFFSSLETTFVYSWNIHWPCSLSIRGECDEASS